MREPGAECAGEIVSPGRCIYCDERCEAGRYFHDYCRLAAEMEEAQRAQCKRQGRPRGDGLDKA